MEQQPPPPPGGYQPPPQQQGGYPPQPPPPPPPQYGYVPPPGGGSKAPGMVAGPAIALMILAGVSIMLLILRLVGQLLFAEFFNQFTDQENPELTRIVTRFGILIWLTAIFINVIVFFGALRMKALQNWSLALIATILVMLPCNCPCCLLGVPIGVWSLIVLLNGEVKAAFRS